MENCLACQIIQDPTISPGGHIKEYDYWILGHIIEPIPVKGWLVLRTKRHTEGIIGLNTEESIELGPILNIVPKVIQEVTGAEMVFALCFGGLVKHLHFHLIPKLPNDDVKGPALFMKYKKVKENPSLAIDVNDCIDVINQIKMLL